LGVCVTSMRQARDANKKELARGNKPCTFGRREATD
jgi:hypothetical protein